MTVLEQAIITAAIKQAQSLGQFQIAEVLVGLILADQPTRDAFVKQAAADAVIVLQPQLDAVDADAAAKKKALADSITELDAVATAVVDSGVAEPAVDATP